MSTGTNHDRARQRLRRLAQNSWNWRRLASRFPDLKSLDLQSLKVMTQRASPALERHEHGELRGLDWSRLTEYLSNRWSLERAAGSGVVPSGPPDSATSEPGADKQVAPDLLLRPCAEDQLRLFNLNIAHGRRQGPHQALVPSRVMRANLRKVAHTLGHLGPDVVALQEADGPSAWSGNFDHVATLSRWASLPSHYRGDHNPFQLGRFRLASGTALLARQPLLEPRSHRFAHSWRDTKGFVLASLRVPEWGTEVDVVSVHLDFLAPSVRRRQISGLADVLAGRGRPLVVLGDLNCCYRWERKSLDLLTSTLGLRAQNPEAGAPTYPARRPRRRLDWILISKELDFAGYHTVPTPLSDHLALVADLRLRAAC